jgi:RecA/RadA recombinase
MSDIAARARQLRKHIKEIITDINGSSDQHSNSAEPTNPLPRAADQLSDPTFERALPFPFVGSEVPVRFKVAEGNWQYVGRTKFKELLQELRKVQGSEVYSTVWLYGTQGYGKSHLLAALVCYLAAQDEQVVYISECRALLEDPIGYFRAAMLFAWADNIAIQKETMTLNTLEKIREFFKSKENVIFVIDQMNALKTDGPGEKERREELSGWMKRFAFRHKKVYSSSANNMDFHKEAQNENQHSVLSVYGGLTRVSHRKIMS